MTIHPLAGRQAPPELLIDVNQLEKAYYEHQPDPDDPDQKVSFGTSGHRGSPLEGSFNEAHILAITRAICEYRQSQGITRPSVYGERHARRFRSWPSARHSKFWQPMAWRPLSRRRWRHPDAGHLSCDSRSQPGKDSPPSRWNCRHPLPQSSFRRRLQI